MIRMMMLIPMAAVLLACGLVARSDDPAAEVVETPDAPTQAEVVEIPLAPTQEIREAPASLVTGDLPLPLYAGDSLIEEKIIEYPVIVNATMTSFSSDTFIYPDDTFRPVLQFNLKVSEYLKGTGPSSIVAVWFSGRSYDTRDEADKWRTVILAERDDQWDDREAIFFLFDLSILSPLSTQPQLTNQYALGLGSEYSDDDFYSLHSRQNKRWLPAATSTGSPGDGQEFLLDVPPTTETITLGDLKSRITEVTAELGGGDGSEEYRECVLDKYRYMRNQRNWPEERGHAYTTWNIEQNLESGQPAGTVLDQIEAYGGYPDIKLPIRLEGKDSALFDTADGASTAIDRDKDGQYDTIKYDEMVRLARPLPAGEYRFDLKEPWPKFLICDFVISNEWTVTVTSPAGVLHELLFDPVTVGTGVAAGDTNGVLKPASFTGADGLSASIGRIAYESASAGSGQPGTVTLGVSSESGPDDVLGGHVLDFIELDGSVSLSLDVFDATVDNESGILTWNVASQPWEDGDRLMVRIRRAPPE